jgi:hypothetical protein
MKLLFGYNEMWNRTVNSAGETKSVSGEFWFVIADFLLFSLFVRDEVLSGQIQN